MPLLSARPAVTLVTLKRAATNFAAWWTETRWVWAVCPRLLPDSVAAVIWTRALLRLSPARLPLGYRATQFICTKNNSNFVRSKNERGTVEFFILPVILVSILFKFCLLNAANKAIVWRWCRRFASCVQGNRKRAIWNLHCIVGGLMKIVKSTSNRTVKHNQLFLKDNSAVKFHLNTVSLSIIFWTPCND